MEITKIYSTRKYNLWPSWHVIFEWEDKFAECLNVEIDSGGVRQHLNVILYRLFRYLPVLKKILDIVLKNTVKFKVCHGTSQLAFLLSPNGLWLYPKRNTIPIFLDTPMSSAEYVLKITKNLPIFWVTAYDYYKKLKKMDPNSTVRYIPLSITDNYILDEYPEKNIDVIQFGRKNSILHKWMIEYCRKYPNTEYVYQTEEGSLTYTSTLYGNLGRYDTRDEYLEMMKKSKISLVSSPCIDSGRKKFFGDMDFVTPRFFESAVNYCYMVGRYTDNTETQVLGLSELCDNVSDYDAFEKLVTRYLACKSFKKKKVYDDFIANNVTSIRVKEISDELSKIVVG